MFFLGGQVHYRSVYENLVKLSLVDGYIYYNSALDSLGMV
jgi:hypothetical protein